MVADDHPSMRKGIIALAQSQPQMEVVAEASSGEDAIRVYDEKLPDVVLMDLRMHGIGGVEATMSICRRHPEAKIIVLSTYDWDEDIHSAIQSGAKSYLLKDMAVEVITGTIRKVFNGDQILPSQVAERLSQRAERQQLTAREKEVLETLIKGRSNKEIATSLGISDETVKSHFKTLFNKLGVRDRTEAAIAAIRHGIVHLD
ncbi:response regulator transcription factor [Pelagicoccus sp. SDUM812002]|uniref:response regulator transcription factor n=1 Tax=Pelagicoccus sp. SDUM812002 TaxID=3041266 RepID=UPI00280F5A9D|nr:response regulator transcription factor [Pelagicoccus sp. SDUM812002]MDQ8184212.1 response regulator transcription factor [Pelagicoccus sp. SDUM812002]